MLSRSDCFLFRLCTSLFVYFIFTSMVCAQNPSNFKSAPDPAETQKWLKSLRFNYSLEQIKKIKQLKLQLYGNINRVNTKSILSNENLKHLYNMPELEFLALPVWTDDHGFRHVSALHKLKHLNATQTRITDASMSVLKDKKALQQLVLAGTKITDKGLVQLRRSKNLYKLNLNNTRISVAGMKHIANMENLQELNLMQTKINDQALPYILKLKALKRLDVGNQLSRKSVEKIKAAFPGIKIN